MPAGAPRVLYRKDREWAANFWSSIEIFFREFSVVRHQSSQE